MENNKIVEKQIIKKAIEELSFKKIGFTEQFLHVHEITLENGIPKIAGLKINNENKQATVYFKVNNELFYFSVLVDLNGDAMVKWTEEEAYHELIFNAVSDSISVKEMLSRITHIKPTETWVGNSLKRNTKYIHNGFSVKVDEVPDTFEEKLERLLLYLEKESKGLQYLSHEATFYIIVESYFYNANTMLGNYYIDSNIIARLNKLNIKLDLNIWSVGNKLID